MSWWESDRGWDQNWDQSWSGWVWWRHSDRAGDWWRDPDHPGDWWRDPDRPGDSAGLSRRGAWGLGCSVCAHAVLPPSRDPGAKVVARATARRRPTVAMALTINLALTLKRRQHITRFVAEFIADSRLTDEVMDALHPAMACGHLMCSINGCTTLACLRYQKMPCFCSSARLNSTENFAEKDSTKSVERRVVKALQEIIVEEKREKNGIMCVLLLPWPFVWMIEDPGSF